jgi:hypothetical protein
MNNIRPEFINIVRRAFLDNGIIQAKPKKLVFKFFGTVKELKRLFNL